PTGPPQRALPPSGGRRSGLVSRDRPLSPRGDRHALPGAAKQEPDSAVLLADRVGERADGRGERQLRRQGLRGGDGGGGHALQPARAPRGPHRAAGAALPADGLSPSATARALTDYGSRRFGPRKR